jgi:hypothetical protein
MRVIDFDTYLMGCEDGAEKTGVRGAVRSNGCSHGQIKAVKATMKTQNQNLGRRVCVLSTMRLSVRPRE